MGGVDGGGGSGGPHTITPQSAVGGLGLLWVRCKSREEGAHMLGLIIQITINQYSQINKHEEICFL